MSISISLGERKDDDNVALEDASPAARPAPVAARAASASAAPSRQAAPSSAPRPVSPSVANPQSPQPKFDDKAYAQEIIKLEEDPRAADVASGIAKVAALNSGGDIGQQREQEKKGLAHMAAMAHYVQQNQELREEADQMLAFRVQQDEVAVYKQNVHEPDPRQEEADRNAAKRLAEAEEAARKREADERRKREADDAMLAKLIAEEEEKKRVRAVSRAPSRMDDEQKRARSPSSRPDGGLSAQDEAKRRQELEDARLAQQLAAEGDQRGRAASGRPVAEANNNNNNGISAAEARRKQELEDERIAKILAAGGELPAQDRKPSRAVGGGDENRDRARSQNPNERAMGAIAAPRPSAPPLYEEQPYDAVPVYGNGGPAVAVAQPYYGQPAAMEGEGGRKVSRAQGQGGDPRRASYRPPQEFDIEEGHHNNGPDYANAEAVGIQPQPSIRTVRRRRCSRRVLYTLWAVLCLVVIGAGLFVWLWIFDGAKSK